MKREPDLIRELLLRLEGLDVPPSAMVSISSSEPELKIDLYSTDQVDYHMSLLYEADLITSGSSNDMMMSGKWIFKRLTVQGHDFVDSVRDPEVWKKTKSGASKVGGWSLGLLKDMATAYLKMKAKEVLPGLDL